MAFKIGQDFKLDVDIVMGWSLNKIYEHMAFYLTQDEEWKAGQAEQAKSWEQKRAEMVAAMKMAIGQK